MPVLGWVIGASVPVVPGREEARDWAVRELAGREYEDARPGLVRRALSWFWDQLTSLPAAGGPGSAVAATVIVAAVAAVIVLAVHRAGGLGRQVRSDRPGGVLADTTLSASQLRSESRSRAREGAWTAAVIGLFRAIARELEERAVLTPSPGRTASEVAREAAPWLPELAEELAAAARLFGDVRYGGRAAGQAAYERLVRLDDAVQASRPVTGGRDTPRAGALVAPA